MAARTHAMALLIICHLVNISFGNGTPAPATDPLAGAREQTIPYLPHGPRKVRKWYYRGDEKVGERILYDNGMLAEERLFKNAQLNGVMRLFYQSGRLFARYPYVQGKLDGIVRFYKEDGQILGESTLVQGTGVLRQFPLRALWLDDKEIPYKNGLVDGTVREWAHYMGGQGVGCDVQQYVGGRLEGWGVTFNEDGSLLASGYCHKGLLHGVRRRFVPKDGPEKGYPKYYIKDKEVSQAVYREAAKKDPILAKSLNDDGRAWGESARKAARR